MISVRDRELDLMLNWTLRLTGSTLGVAISHLALRTFKNSYSASSWSSLCVHGVCAISGGILYTKYTKRVACPIVRAYVDALIEIHKLSENLLPLSLQVWGTLSTAIITCIVLKIFTRSFAPLGVVGLLLQAGIAYQSGKLYAFHADSWPFSIRKYTDEKIREIVKGEYKFNLRYFRGDRENSSQMIVFADQYGQRDDVSPKEVAELFEYGKTVYSESLISRVSLLEPCLSDVTINKLLEHYISNGLPIDYYSASKFRQILLNLTKNDSEKQARVLKAFPK